MSDGLDNLLGIAASIPARGAAIGDCDFARRRGVEISVAGIIC